MFFEIVPGICKLPHRKIMSGKGRYVVLGLYNQGGFNGVTSSEEWYPMSHGKTRDINDDVSRIHESYSIVHGKAVKTPNCIFGVGSF